MPFVLDPVEGQARRFPKYTQNAASDSPLK